MKKIITETLLGEYGDFLRREEKSRNTVKKYVADVRKLMEFAAEQEITKDLMLAYKEDLKERGYGASSINSYLVAANRFFEYMEWYGIRVKQLKVQKEAFVPEERELTKAEYKRLVAAAREQGKIRLAMIFMTICATGIRISELSYLTVASVKRGMMEVDNKGKRRQVLLPEELQKSLMLYVTAKKIKEGVVFRTSNGNPVNRSNIWKEMKAVCGAAGVDSDKVFPHNLRHLFARIFYSLEKDIAKLADILGHESIETTRIYVRTSSREYKKQMRQMDLVMQVI